MKHRTAPVLATSTLLAAALLATACSKTEKKENTSSSAAPVKKGPSADIDGGTLEAFKPALPKVMTSKDHPVTEEKVTLGRQLYYDPRLSKNHDISCNSCHDLAKYGVDGEPTSPGHKKQRGTRNSPSSYNAAGHFRQFWDGRAADVEEQATGPVLNPVEMATKDEAALKAMLASMPGYVEAFKKAFPDDDDPISLKNAGIAMGAFERKLVTPSPWDKFLAGDEKALTDVQKKGFNVFVSTGCSTCHNGTYVGGAAYQKVGLAKPWPNQKDQGRFEVTKEAGDKMMFKVPSLRNVEKTAPYFHDGATKSLDQAVKMMAEHQLGKQLSDEDTKLIVAWLKSLTGELPTDYIKKPDLPESTAKTPKADPS